jgi:hypothetical protein
MGSRPLVASVVLLKSTFRPGVTKVRRKGAQNRLVRGQLAAPRWLCSLQAAAVSIEANSTRNAISQQLHGYLTATCHNAQTLCTDLYCWCRVVPPATHSEWSRWRQRPPCPVTQTIGKHGVPGIVPGREALHLTQWRKLHNHGLRNLYSWGQYCHGDLGEMWARNVLYIYKKYIKLNSMVWVRERTIPTERQPPVSEATANLCG